MPIAHASHAVRANARVTSCDAPRQILYAAILRLRESKSAHGNA